MTDVKAFLLDSGFRLPASGFWILEHRYEINRQNPFIIGSLTEVRKFSYKYQRMMVANGKIRDGI